MSIERRMITTNHDDVYEPERFQLSFLPRIALIDNQSDSPVKVFPGALSFAGVTNTLPLDIIPANSFKTIVLDMSSSEYTFGYDQSAVAVGQFILVTLTNETDYLNTMRSGNGISNQLRPAIAPVRSGITLFQPVGITAASSTNATFDPNNLLGQISILYELTALSVLVAAVDPAATGNHSIWISHYQESDQAGKPTFHLLEVTGPANAALTLKPSDSAAQALRGFKWTASAPVRLAYRNDSNLPMNGIPMIRVTRLERQIASWYGGVL